jgi:hypothetical protein
MGRRPAVIGQKRTISELIWSADSGRLPLLVGFLTLGQTHVDLSGIQRDAIYAVAFSMLVQISALLRDFSTQWQIIDSWGVHAGSAFHCISIDACE